LIWLLRKRIYLNNLLSKFILAYKALSIIILYDLNFLIWNKAIIWNSIKLCLILILRNNHRNWIRNNSNRNLISDRLIYWIKILLNWLSDYLLKYLLFLWRSYSSHYIHRSYCMNFTLDKCCFIRYGATSYLRCVGNSLL
jgi:hypothetical protein